MGLPEYIRQLIHGNRYSIGLKQTKANQTKADGDEKLLNSSIMIFQHGLRLCTIVLDCRSGEVREETTSSGTVNEQFLDYLKSTLTEVGQQVWLGEIRTKITYPEPLEELFQVGRSYF